MFKWFLNRLEQHGRKAIIMDRDDKEPYLERYYIAWPDSEKRQRKDIPFNCFLHRFMRSDDPVFHNHPWKWYRTVILKGGYWEHTPWGTEWRGVGHTRYVVGDKLVPYPRSITIPIKLGTNTISHKFSLIHQDLHWVEVPKPGETWTLFIRGRDHGKDWGFVPRVDTGKWIQHEEYLRQQRELAQR